MEQSERGGGGSCAVPAIQWRHCAYHGQAEEEASDEPERSIVVEANLSYGGLLVMAYWLVTGALAATVGILITSIFTKDAEISTLKLKLQMTEDTLKVTQNAYANYHPALGSLVDIATGVINETNMNGQSHEWAFHQIFARVKKHPLVKATDQEIGLAIYQAWRLGG